MVYVRISWDEINARSAAKSRSSSFVVKFHLVHVGAPLVFFVHHVELEICKLDDLH
jgi:hypothetical protein